MYLCKHSNVFIIYVDINIPWKKTSMPEGWCMGLSFRNRIIQISWFLIREIIEVATSRSAIQSYCIYKHNPLVTAGVLIRRPAKWNVSRIDTNTVTQIFWPITVVRNWMVKGRNPITWLWTRVVGFRSRPWWNSAGRGIIEIHIWSLITSWGARNNVIEAWDMEFPVQTDVMTAIGGSPKNSWHNRGERL